jgi:NagD protein
VQELDLLMAIGFLIDMDGVIYRGSQVIPGADTFVRRLREQDIPFLFLTNNSQRTRRDVATKLTRIGIDAREEDIYTCAMATASFLAGQQPNGTAYVIGEGGLLQALHDVGYSIVDHDPDFVVVGEGRTLTLEMMEVAVRHVMNAMLEAATGVKAFSVGKPSPVMMRAARKALGLSTAEVVMVGDTMETDILGGVQMGYRTVLVLTGSTQRVSLERYAYAPHYVVDSIDDLCDLEWLEAPRELVAQV